MEAFLGEIGVGLERDFKLEPMAIKEQIESDIRLSLFEERIRLDVAQARRTINYFPMQREEEIDYLSSNPLVALVPSGDRVRVSYGNRRMTMLKPQFFDYDDSLSQVAMEIDGERREVPFGTIATVGEQFSVHPPEGYRVNIIGWTRPGLKDESAQPIKRGEIRKRFSIDRSGTLYRVEVYREEKFSGMVLVKFGAEVAKSLSSRSEQKKENDGQS